MAHGHRASPDKTRTNTAAPLPGKSLVVYDPRYRAACDFIPIKDAYSQELSGLDAVIETAFGHMTTAMNCEIKPLCYPQATVFCFACALVGYNAFAISKGAIAAEHGRAESEMLSHYFLSTEIASVTDGTLVVLPDERCKEMEQIDQSGFAWEVRRIIGVMEMSRYRKSVRGLKKKPPKRRNKSDSVHVSTKRILGKRK